jgi:hypothetical protein
MLGAVLGAMVLAEREGGWHRLKICREETCRRVFFDKSKNQSKTWCSMQACGNRSKTRTYRDRQRELPPLPERPPPPLPERPPSPLRRPQPATLPSLPPVPPAP